MDIKDIVVDEKIDTNFLPAYFAIYDRAMNAFSIINECNVESSTVTLLPFSDDKDVSKTGDFITIKIEALNTMRNDYLFLRTHEVISTITDPLLNVSRTKFSYVYRFIYKQTYISLLKQFDRFLCQTVVDNYSKKKNYDAIGSFNSKYEKDQKFRNKLYQTPDLFISYHNPSHSYIWNLISNGDKQKQLQKIAAISYKGNLYRCTDIVISREELYYYHIKLRIFTDITNEEDFQLQIDDSDINNVNIYFFNEKIFKLYGLNVDNFSKIDKLEELITKWKLMR